jgi:hypothetical protein
MIKFSVIGQCWKQITKHNPKNLIKLTWSIFSNNLGTYIIKKNEFEYEFALLRFKKLF